MPRVRFAKVKGARREAVRYIRRANRPVRQSMPSQLTIVPSLLLHRIPQLFPTPLRPHVWSILYPWAYRRSVAKRYHHPEGLSATMRRHQIIFCHIPKAAGTSVRKAMHLTDDEMSHVPLRDYQKGLRKSFDAFFRFAFVRHPVTRLYSAFYFIKRGGFRGVPQDQLFARSMAPYLTDFPSFVRWLSPAKRWMYIHFFPQSFFLMGAGGRLLTNWIGAFETLSEDFEDLTHHLAQRGMAVEPLPRANVTPHKPELESLPDDVVEKIHHLYAEDFDLLGYDPARFHAPPKICQRT